MTNREKLKEVLGFLRDDAVKFTAQGKIVLECSFPEAVRVLVGLPALELRVYPPVYVGGFCQVNDKDQSAR